MGCRFFQNNEPGSSGIFLGIPNLCCSIWGVDFENNEPIPFNLKGDNSIFDPKKTPKHINISHMFEVFEAI